jgi:hypothetical protein
LCFSEELSTAQHTQKTLMYLFHQDSTFVLVSHLELKPGLGMVVNKMLAKMDKLLKIIIHSLNIYFSLKHMNM